MTLDNKLLKHLAVFCENVSLDINEHLANEETAHSVPEIFKGKSKEDKRIEDDILGTPEIEFEPYKAFVMSKVISKKASRKKTDTTTLSLDAYKEIKLAKQTTLAHLKQADFAKAMNEHFEVNKCINSWINIANQRTPHYQEMDY